ncbi:protein SCO1/2 [Pseudomonas duriflava]|uniref:Protein SCO1/2 n=1 Tax=Pseudomonas duriflava TaxID=459528 RepID=A0A562QLI6_9PSED|nr:SCO family protein [Pseudomonas duriflava]TWI57579.1 protein SCO1/2 [Pseudomonas duriflava]
MTTARRTALVIVALIALIVAASLGYRAFQAERGPDPAALREAGIILLPKSKPLPALEFTTQDKEAVSTDTLKGQWRLFFFGYTFCPDVCPATLAQLRQLFMKLPERDRDRLGVTFVTVDPARDTPERLKQYIEFFNPRFQALASSLENTQKLSSAIGIPFIPADTTKEHYTVDHGANLALVNPNAEIVGYVRQPLALDALARELPALMSDQP